MSGMGMGKIRWEQEATLREKAMFVGFLFGMLLVFYNMFWDPHSIRMEKVAKKMSIIKPEIEASKKTIDETQNKIAKESAESEKALSGGEAYVSKLLNVAATDANEEVSKVIKALGKRKFKRRVKTEGITMSDIVKKDKYNMVLMTIELSGAYSGILSYLNELAGVEHPILVRSVSLITASGEAKSITAKVDLELFVPVR